MSNNYDTLLYTSAFLLPLFGIFFGGVGCRMLTTDSKLKPPNSVFSIWGLLYILLIWSWFLTIQNKDKDKDLTNFNIKYVLYVILSFFLGLWLRIFSTGLLCANSKVGGFYTLVICVGLLITIIALEENWNKLLLTPLLIWLIIATFINADEASK